MKYALKNHIKNEYKINKSIKSNNQSSRSKNLIFNLKKIMIFNNPASHPLIPPPHLSHPIPSYLSHPTSSYLSPPPPHISHPTSSYLSHPHPLISLTPPPHISFTPPPHISHPHPLISL